SRRWPARASRSSRSPPTAAPSLVPIPADVADAASTEAAGRRVLDELRVPDVVLANAGIDLAGLG
ncbi:MAG TPA: hypothetical protein VJS92_01095, partial [Candidatus Polarisedimenticolaceae bacterium]|nr:hypothetical protein [Candidatus Polarisedimenticolaceae bacterium]